jgi:cytochrome c oxidase subunit 1
MTTLQRTATAAEIAAPRRQLGRIAWKWMVTTDHKVIGNLYFVTSMLFFLFGGILALGNPGRTGVARLAVPLLRGLQPVLHHARHDHVVALCDAIVCWLRERDYAAADRRTRCSVPAPEHAGVLVLSFRWADRLSRLLSPSGAASFGWFAYAPLNSEVNSPGVGGDLWIMGLYMAGLGTILGAVNFTTTILTMRAPGMTMFRMPIFTWNILVTSFLVLVVFPILAAALLVLEADRVLGAHIFDAANGGPILWQHLFWFFGHPEVYIIALPFFGIITEVLPVFSRKPIFGYVGLVLATMLIGALSVAVWAHHMFVTGAVNLPFFSFMTFLIAIPTGVKFFNWIGTMWGGNIAMRTPMLWAVGFLTTFLFGGLTGVILASPPLDFAVSDTYFVVAHFITSCSALSSSRCSPASTSGGRS